MTQFLLIYQNSGYLPHQEPVTHYQIFSTIEEAQDAQLRIINLEREASQTNYTKNVEYWYTTYITSEFCSTQDQIAYRDSAKNWHIINLKD